MRYIIIIGFVCGLSLFFALSCAKYKDPPATNDPRLTNPYCNDPTAVNYNWGFPGKPDNSICFYPTDVFKGNYEYYDSVFLQPSGLFVRADSFPIVIARLTDSTMTVSGFCGSGGTLSLKANRLYIATIDTTMGDTTTINRGQAFCTTADTVNGTFTKDRISDSILYVSLYVASDSGVASIHSGTAYKKH